jgi:outer membrane lipoprotein-sorting protein
MNKKYFIVLIMLMFTSGIRHWAADPSAILKKVEANYSGQNSPRNMEAMMIMKIQHGDNLKVRKLKTWTKNNDNGYDSRVLKFVSPSDVKDIGLLILSEDLMYLYLPEFHRIRRIASSNRKDSFQGSDLSYEDLGFSDFSRDYVPKFLSEDETRWVLELNEKSDRQKAYTKIILTVDKTSLMPLSMDLYNRSGELWKHAEYSSVKLSSYTVINALKMVDKKRNSTTFLEFKDIKLDQNLDSVIFTQRFLKRRIG